MEPDPQPDRNAPAAAQRRGWWPRRWRYRSLLACALLLMIAGSATWLGRERIAGNLIDTYLAEQGVAARYRLVEITPTRQVIADLVVGDPAAPDLVAERVEVAMALGLLGPGIAQVTIDKARLYGSYRGGKLSFGALDPLVFAKSDEPARLPALNVALKDARARIDSDFGAVGVKLAGTGRLDDGFAGTLAVAAPGLGVETCRAGRASLFGALTTKGGAARLAGPLRLGEVACGGASLARAEIGTVLTLGKTLDQLEGAFTLAGAGLAAGGARAVKVSGSAKAAVSANGVVVDHDVALGALTLGSARLARARAAGSWRALGGAAARGEWSGTLAGEGLDPGPGLAAALVAARASARGTLAEPVLAQLGSAMARALTGAGFTSEARLRRGDEGWRIAIPQARLTSRTGEAILALSQVNWSLAEGGRGLRRGNFLTGGRGLPRINGRIAEDQAGGGLSLRLAMADYRAGSSRIAVPRLSLSGTPAGDYRFSGTLAASGALPGGAVRGLEVPLEGRWSPREGLLLGTACASLRFAALRLAGLELAGQRLSLCPASGTRAMLRYADTLAVAASTQRLALTGQMGAAGVRLAAARAVLRYPGALAIEGVDLAIGDGSEATRLSLASLTGTLGKAAQGTFSGGAGGLAGVPLDLAQMAGRWRFAEGALAITEASFTLTDRTTGQPRFEPLAGRDARVTIEGDAITAAAALHHPASGQQVARFSLAHDLAKAAGSADLVVDALTFGPGLDAENLTYLAKGVIADARGTVQGRGRIDWAGDQVTSSGRFASDGLDFAAAFGPVKGVAGELVFTDLLGLTTAPDQRLSIAAINTGVEVLDGQIRFSLSEGTRIALAQARWPFMGGELALRPVVLDFSQPSEKRYIFELAGLDAATFIAEMELTNLGATGTFDGTVPIIFDASGNGRIANGVLTARAPGGSLSYIGDLTYEDMGAISNYAFRALRSLDYRDMRVVLDGSLTGEIISKFQFDGVRQGAGTSRNFITRKLAQLPILFRVNVKAESFYELSTVVRSFFDVSYLGNPVDRGLLKLENGRFVPTRQPPVPPNMPPALPLSANSVQPPESEDRP